MVYQKQIATKLKQLFLKTNTGQMHYLSFVLYCRVQSLKKLKGQLNKFCLKFNSRHHLGAKELKEINWLPTIERAEQRVLRKAFE